MDERKFTQTMEYIIGALLEKGYDPYEQLQGYLLKNEPGYITRHKNARQMIVELDRERVRDYIRKKYDKEQ